MTSLDDQDLNTRQVDANGFVLANKAFLPRPAVGPAHDFALLSRTSESEVTELFRTLMARMAGPDPKEKR